MTYAGTAQAATTIVVPRDFPTIQQAVDAASPGDTVKVKPGVYKENVDIQTDNLTILGTDPVKVVVDGFDPAAQGKPTFQAIANNVRFQSMTVRHGGQSNIFCVGDGCTVKNVRMPYSRINDCIRIVGNDALLESNRLRSCQGRGIWVSGDDARVLSNDVRQTNESCVRLEGHRALIRGNVSRGCEDGDGFYVQGDNNQVIRNQASLGADECYEVHGVRPRLHRNSGSACDMPFHVTGENMVLTSNHGRDSQLNSFFINCFDLGGGEPSATACDEGLVSGNLASGVADDHRGFDIRVSTGTGTFEVVGNKARYTAADGFDISLSDGIIANNSTFGAGYEGEAGFRIFGQRNTIKSNRAERSGGDGIALYGSDNVVSRNVMTKNSVDGLHVESGTGNRLEANEATENHADGIENDGSLTDVVNNVSKKNRSDCTNDGTIDQNSGNRCADGSNFTHPGTGIDDS